MSNLLSSEIVYKEWLKELKFRIRQSQIRASVHINSDMLELYWSIGADIVAKQESEGWGSAVIPQLSRDLRAEFPDSQGFSERNLREMRRYFLFYSQSDLIRHQLGAKLGKGSDLSLMPVLKKDSARHESLGQFPQLLASIPWRHHVEIISHVHSFEEALFYIRETLEGGWSRAMLVRNLKTDLYSRQGKAPTNFAVLLPSPQSELADEKLKDPYNLDFVALTKGYQEQELENALLQNITSFLVELGQGFAYVGKQVPIKVGSKKLTIDLLFYHLELRCYVVIELKVVEFEAEFMGKLGVYVAAIDEQRKKESDNPTIGLLICKTKDNVYAEYALKGIGHPIGISSYELTELLPSDFKSSLPSIEEIESNLAD